MTTEPSIEPKRLAMLIHNIESNRQSLISLVNAGVVSLFGEIGKELNSSLSNKENTSALSDISAELVPRYGFFFAEDWLRIMKQSAHEFSEITATSLDQLNIFRYIRDNDWDLHKKSVKTLDDPSELLLQEVAPDLIQNIVKNAYVASFLSAIRLLFDSAKRATAIKNSEKLSSTSAECIAAIASHIKSYTNIHNQRLNSRLNLAFQGIGHQINDIIVSEKAYGLPRSLILHNISGALIEKYGEFFNEEQLDNLAKFTEKFKAIGVLGYISGLVSWAHILTLLPLDEVEEVMFYARLTVTKQLSVADLQEQIAANVYGGTSGAKEQEQRTASTIKATAVTKKKGSVTGTTVLIDYRELVGERILPNIFNNPFFLQFLLGF
jgi:predicted nuclease of restriction endonuclease-like (RecB) superfamily